MSLVAAATGIGSWPGTTPRRVAEVIVGDLHQLPYLPELPARGVGADIIGRAGALLVDVAIDTVPRGYRIVARPGSVMRRSASLLDEDLDALEEAWEKAGGGDGRAAVKVQAPGPITLAAALELPNGHRAITDPGAVRDLAGSLAEGVAVYRAEVARRLGVPVFDADAQVRGALSSVGRQQAVGRACGGRRQFIGPDGCTSRRRLRGVDASAAAQQAFNIGLPCHVGHADLVQQMHVGRAVAAGGGGSLPARRPPVRVAALHRGVRAGRD